MILKQFYGDTKKNHSRKQVNYSCKKSFIDFTLNFINNFDLERVSKALSVSFKNHKTLKLTINISLSISIST